MKIFGFDPSLEAAGWCILDTETMTVLKCGVITLPKEDQKLDRWAKTQAMLRQLVEFKDYPCGFDVKMDLVVCESQRVFYGPASGSLLPLAAISGCMMTTAMFSDIKTMYADPSVWTKKIPKENRTETIESKVGKLETWGWTMKMPPKSIRHNAIDAVGMAIWASENPTV